MGQMGQAYRSDVAQSCSEYTLMVLGIYGSGLLGIILLIGGASISEKLKEKKDPNSLELLKERYAKGEITKEEFDKIKEDLEWSQ